ncbi:hypothetical protein AcV7_001720 [Taiwanofungus camphoratus]|nr:hypothetical protein AcV7_001720 [Antrodia cinnamomea]
MESYQTYQRHLCFICDINTNSFLSDAYLENVLDWLWTCWKDAGGPAPKGKEVLRLQVANFTSDTSLSTGLPTPSVFDIPSGSLAAHPSHDGTDVSPPPATTPSSSDLATKAQENESASSHSAVSRSDCVRNDLTILTKEALLMWINDHGLNSTPIAKQQIACMKKGHTNSQTDDTT